ncbi:MAG: hypothetical protein FWG77_04645 [Treponema sp.]|nr:hypothetical protein [Treponema sp.]
MHERVNTAITELNTRLKEIYAGDYITLVLYGSAVGAAYRADYSDINVLIILEKNSSDNIFKLGKAAKNLLGKYRISPFMMTKEELTSALDVFPLEFYDILEAHTIVYGDKNILNLNVKKGNLRHEIEEKLRGTVNDIHGMILAAEGEEKLLGKYLASWPGMSGILFRGLLRLKGKSIGGLDADAIIKETEKEYGVKLESFSTLNDLRYNKKPLTMSASSFADTILEPLNALIKIVDAMDGGRA